MQTLLALRTHTTAYLRAEQNNRLFILGRVYDLDFVYNEMGDVPWSCPFPCGIRTPPTNAWLGPTKVHTPNGISTGPAILAQLMTVTNRHTDTSTMLYLQQQAASMHCVHAM